MRLSIIAITALILTVCYRANGQSQQSFVISAGGTVSCGGSMTNASVMGEPIAAAQSQGRSLTQYGGFLGRFILNPSLDTDGDGLPNELDWDNDGDLMPDTWEVAHGLQLLLADAHDDTDGDRSDNLAEYVALTDPKATDSVFDIRIARLSGSALEVSWQTGLRRTYSLSSTTNLMDIWTNVDTVVDAVGTQGRMFYTNTSPSTGMEFYRVGVKLQDAGP